MNRFNSFVYCFLGSLQQIRDNNLSCSYKYPAQGTEITSLTYTTERSYTIAAINELNILLLYVILRASLEIIGFWSAQAAPTRQNLVEYLPLANTPWQV